MKEVQDVARGSESPGREESAGRDGVGAMGFKPMKAWPIGS